MLSLLVDGIPPLLREMPNFVVCREEVRDGKATKVPYLTTGTRAMTDKPQTWLTLKTALRQMELGKFPGLGFCRSGPIRFLDGDGCLDADGNVGRWDWGLAELIVQPGPMLDLLGPYSYTEISVHATGLHLVLFAHSPITGLQIEAFGEHSGFGAYTTTNRYLWLTGHRRSLGPKFGEDASGPLAEFMARCVDLRHRMQAAKSAARRNGDSSAPAVPPAVSSAPLSASSNGNPGPSVNAAPSVSSALALVPAPPDLPLTDTELWALIGKKGNARLRAVLGGDSESVQRTDMTPSGFDFAAAQTLCWYLGPDPGRIDSLMRGIPGFSERSEKWDSRRPGGTYGSETIAKAIVATTGRYQRPRPPGRPSGSGSGSGSGGGGGGGGGGAASRPALAFDGLSWTEVGNAERFRLRFGEELRYSGALKYWLSWGDRPRWKPDETGRAMQLGVAQVKAMAEEGKIAEDPAFTSFAMKCHSNSQITAMLNLAKVLDGISIKVDDLDRNPWLLNNESGTVTFGRGEDSMILREHRKEDYITQICGCGYVEGARHLVWDRFLETALPDPELRDFLQKAAGYTLTGITREECCFLLVGEGRNGKGTFLHAMQTMMGDYATTASFDTFLLAGRRDQQAELASFRGKRMVVAQEAGTRATFNEALLKNLTGGDRIKCRGMYENPFEYLPQFKLWFAMNHMPDVRDASPGFWQRIRVIPFQVNFAGSENQNLKLELTQPEVLEAVLAWAVEGCLRWQEEGLGMPPVVAAATARYQEETDSVRLWIEERCEEHMSLELRSSEGYVDYSEFCKSQNLIPASAKAFKESLEKKGFPLKRNNGSFFIGLQLKSTSNRGRF